MAQRKKDEAEANLSEALEREAEGSTALDATRQQLEEATVAASEDRTALVGARKQLEQATAKLADLDRCAPSTLPPEGGFGSAIMIHSHR